MWCVCAQLYMDQFKKIFDHFICFWKWFFSLFVYMFSTYFVFHCLNMFCVEKQVLKFFVTHLATRQSWNPSREHIQKLLQFTRENLHDSLRDLTSRETPRNSFLKSFTRETCFKPLSSSLRPLFHYFYIKTKLIWMVFHSINISKVIINSFHSFWSLDYVLESFLFLVGIFIIGVGKT